VTELSIGLYGIQIWVNDTYGNLLIAEFSLTIYDASPPVWAQIPVDQGLELGAFFNYDLNATDISGLDHWWINDTTHFFINTNGIITNATTLAVGQYGLQVWVNDSLNLILTSTFQVVVQDTTPPQWIEPPTDQVIEFGSEFTYDLNVTDLSPIDQWWLDDTDRFTIDWQGRIRSIIILTPGTYGLTIFVSDIYGNTQSTSITITVEDMTTPPPPVLPPWVLVLAIGGITGGILGAVGLVIVLRRRRIGN
jgi:hypothetical protein